MRHSIRTAAAVLATLVGVLVAGPTSAAHATTVVPVNVTPICQAVPGSYPGATVVVGSIQEHVYSIGKIQVCLYRYLASTAGLPIPQLGSGCGTPCFKIDSPGASAGFAPYVSITMTADGQPVGYTYAPPPVGVGYTEPICVAVGTPAPQCNTATLNLNL